MTADFETRYKELAARVKVLEAENERLAERAEDVLLLGLVAESISTLESTESILDYVLERVALLKDIPYCAFCELAEDQPVILNAYAAFRNVHTGDDEITLKPELAERLAEGAQIVTRKSLEAQEVTIRLEDCTFEPGMVLLLPFSARIVPEGVVILIFDQETLALDQDDDSDEAETGFVKNAMLLLARILEVTISRLDILSLVKELQYLNKSLNQEVVRRQGELHQTTEQLRQVMVSRLQVEDDLLRQRDLITNISASSPVGITVLDTEGAITYANQRAEEVLCLTKSKIIGRQYNAPAWKITDFAGKPYPDDQLPFAQVMRTGSVVHNVQHAIEWPDGNRVMLTINAAPLFDENFKIDGVVALLDDVTEQILVNNEFRRLQNFNTSIVQNISDGIIVQDADGRFTFVNPAAAEILGYRAEEILGTHWRKVIPPDQHGIITAADSRRQEGKSDRYEVDLLRKDSVRIPVLVSGSPYIEASSGEFLGTLAVFTDISEHKHAENVRRVLGILAVQLSAMTGIDDVLRGCMESAVKNTSLEAGGIYLVDSRTGEIRLAYSQGLSQAFIEGGSYYAADTPNARLIQAGEPVYLDLPDLASTLSKKQFRDQLQSAAILPIHHDEKVIASLNMGSFSNPEILDTDRHMLEMIAAQVGSAFARAQAETRLTQRVDQLKMINDIGEQIASVLELEQVLKRTAQLIHESFGYQHVALFLIDPEKDAAVLKTMAGDFDHIFSPGHQLRLGQGLVGNAALKNEIFLANQIKDDPYYVNFYPDTLHMQSELCVPIHIGGEAIGVIDAQSAEPYAFDENDVMVMETLADQVAAAIHNANLHAEVQNELVERKRIETALRESEQKFRSIVEASPMGMHMYQLTPDGSLVFMDANPAAELILGVDNKQFRGKKIEEAFPALADTEVPERYRLAAAEGKNWNTQQIDYHENEIRGAFEVYAFQTSPGRMVALFLDITERKKADEALRHSENTLRSLFRAAPTGIGLVSERQLVQVNERVCEMVGRPREALVGQSARILYPSDEEFEFVGTEKYQQIQASGTGTVETRWQHENGQIIDVLMSSTPIDAENLALGVTFTALDITDRKRAERQLQLQVQRLAALNKIDSAITGNLDLKAVIEVLLDQTVQQLNADAAAVLVYKPLTQTLEYYADTGFRTDLIRSINLRLGDGFAGRAVLERSMIQVTELDAQFQDVSLMQAESFAMYFGVPLIAKGQIRGVLEVCHRELLRPSPNWLHYLETLAGQAAIAIDNAEMVNNLERSNVELRLAYKNTLEGWAKALELRDFETEGHSRRVTDLCLRMARAAGVPEEHLIHIQRGSLLHDIGKLAISDQILLKPGPLNDDEWDIMRQHPIYAYEMLYPIEFLRPALEIPHYHHEKWDGTGYPYGLSGEAIPLAARIFAIIDVWDALNSDRPYRNAWPEDKVLAHIESLSGSAFDPALVPVFLDLVNREKS